ncbi:SirB2 family protein [Vibrio sp.]|nr:SirB2 family protein [Vibrio sp.]
MYEIVKSLHIVTIGISVSLLSIRYILMMLDSPMLDRKFLKVAPHAVDTLLLLSGLTLIYITGFTPFNSPWLMEKITAVLAYISLGVFALKLGKNKMLRSFAFVGALGWLIIAGKAVISKSAILFG